MNEALSKPPALLKTPKGRELQLRNNNKGTIYFGCRVMLKGKEEFFVGLIKNGEFYHDTYEYATWIFDGERGEWKANADPISDELLGKIEDFIESKISDGCFPDKIDYHWPRFPKPKKTQEELLEAWIQRRAKDTGKTVDEVYAEINKFIDEKFPD